jgi:hypothetical protein
MPAIIPITPTVVLVPAVLDVFHGVGIQRRIEFAENTTGVRRNTGHGGSRLHHGSKRRRSGKAEHSGEEQSSIHDFLQSIDRYSTRAGLNSSCLYSDGSTGSVSGIYADG